MGMNDHEIAVEIIRRMDTERKRKEAYRRKLVSRAMVAVCLALVVGALIGIPLFVSDDLLKESAWSHVASLSGGDEAIGLMALIAVIIVVACFSVFMILRKKKGG